MKHNDRKDNTNNTMTRRAALILAAVMLTVSVTGCGERVQSLIDRVQSVVSGEAGAGSTAEPAPAEAPGSEGTSAAPEAAGGSGTQEAADASQMNAAEAAGEAGTAGTQAPAGEGNVLNICCWDETLEDLMIRYYPNYEDKGDGTGSIGNIRVNWIMADSEDEYLGMMTKYLVRADYLGADDRIDLFAASENDLSAYVCSSYALDVKGTLQLTDAELDDQYPFTQQQATDAEGILKAVSYKASPGVFVYRRSIARQVLGSDDPAVVQQAVSGWDAFVSTAGEMKKKGFYMLSGYLDPFSPFRCAAKTHWERDGKLQVDSTFTQWVTYTKLMTDGGFHHGTLVGDDTWVADQGPAGRVFGFFRSAEDIDTRMAAYSLANAALPPGEGNGIYGDYAVCAGPQPFCRGGLWILAAKGSDNLSLDAEIMRKLTCDSSILQEIAQGEGIPVNTVSGMKMMAENGEPDPFLGGQNPYEVYENVCSRISMISAGKYDRRLGDAYRDVMFHYFTGEVDLEEAEEDFRRYVKQTMPEIATD